MKLIISLLVLLTCKLQAADNQALTGFQGYERVLLVGCGDGSLAAAIAAEVKDGFVLVIDGDAALIAEAEERFDADLFANLQFKESALFDPSQFGKFDVVIENTPDLR